MSYAGNSPRSGLVLRLEARKSFAADLYVMDYLGRPLDITGCEITFVMKDLPFDTSDTADTDNLIGNDRATLVTPDKGHAQFNFQATDLDHKPGERPYSIVLIDANGYSSVLVKGVVDLQQNTEFYSTAVDYTAANPTQSIEVTLRSAITINIYAGQTLPPGTTSFTDGDKAMLDTLWQQSGN